MAQPKYRISNFTKDNVYWLNNCSPVKIGGNTMITGGPYTYAIAKYGNTGMNDLDDLSNATGGTTIQIGSSDYRNTIFIDGAGIFMVNYIGSSCKKIHAVSTSGTMFPAQIADIATTANNNIIYTLAAHLGVGYYFKASGGSATSLTVDDTDFDALGAANTVGHNKIYNVTKNTEFTITSISGTGNVTLNFDAVAGITPAANDYFFVFIDDKFSLTTSPTNINQQFIGQKAPLHWKRKIIKLDDRYFILNGNYLAMLSYDETTITDDYQQFPLGVQGLCMDVNNDRILVGGIDKNNNGLLMVYDGFSSYFNSIVYTKSVPKSICAYQSGWLVCFASGEIQYTDGVSWKKITQPLDSERKQLYQVANPNSMAIINNKIYLAFGDTFPQSLRQQGGLHIYDIEYEQWSFMRCQDYMGYTIYTPSSVFVLNSTNTGMPDVYYAHNKAIGKISDNAGQEIKKEVYLDITLPKKETIKNVELNFGISYNSYEQSLYNTAQVTVCSGDGRYGINSTMQITDASTKTKLYPESNYDNGYTFVGQEVMVLSSGLSTDLNIDERTYITAIEKAGEVGEAWTVSPALTSDFTAVQTVGLLGVSFSETKTIKYSEINKDLIFNVKNHYGDKLYLHITYTGYLDLRGIYIY